MLLFGFHLSCRLTLYIHIYPPKKIVSLLVSSVYVKYTENIHETETGKEVRNKSIISNKESV
jgi:hypothetical protein